MEYIKRSHYLKKIEPFIDQELIKIIVGQRRVGKSYFLYQIMDKIKREKPQAKIIYINKELYKFDSLKNSDDLYNYIKTESQDNKNYVFIDEIQEIENYEKAVRSLLAEQRFDIYCTGSNASMFSSEFSTLLSGRYIEIKMHSLSYPEFLIFQQLENTPDSLMKYIKYGGLPYLYNLELKDEIVYEYIKNIYNTIVLKDVVSRKNIRNVDLLENLISYLASNCGSIISAKKIADFLKSQKIKIQAKTVGNYLQYLVESYFINKVRRARIRGKKIFEFGEKYYFEDLGLKHSIRRYTQQDIGKVLENMVYNHMKFKGFNINVGKLGDKEVDFVCQKGEQKIYIQVCYLIPDKKVYAREFGNLLKIEDNYPKIVISMDQSIGDSYKGIEHLHIRDFLADFD
jgi:hypothetical protein